MRNVVTAVAVLLLVFCGSAYAQSWTWQYVKAFPDTNFKGNTGGQGLAVDGEGKIWHQFYGVMDSVLNPVSGKYQKVRLLYCFNKDGTPASFSPMKFITVGGVTDTLFNSSRGLRRDHNGNILAGYFDTIYRINHKTGEGMAKVVPTPGTTVTTAAVDASGKVFVGPVLPGNPIKEFDADLNYLGNVVDASLGYSRYLEVSADGNTVYWPAFTIHQIYVYSRPDEFSAFALTDSILQGFTCESMAWSRDRSVLWMDAGSYFDGTNNYPGVTTSWDYNTWYAYDFTRKAIVDSIKWKFYTPQNPDERPRAIDFSVSGDTAYVQCFGASYYPAIEMFVKTPVGVWEHAGTITGFTLFQNYPNPFNPSTEIKFSIGAPGQTTLKVYDVLGREVATLVNERLPIGTYHITFDASNLPSGTYVYQLRSADQTLTRKMLLLK